MLVSLLSCPLYFFALSVVLKELKPLDIDHDPRKVARDERKAKIAKNERQHQQNLARSQSDQGAASTSAPPAAGREFQSQRKTEIGHTLAVTRTSTASMGKFDKKLNGEKKLKGIKRKVRLYCLSRYNSR